MGNAKFQVIIKNIDENALGPILGSLPNNIHPEIMRVSGRTTSKLAPKTEPQPAPIVGKFDNVALWIQQLPVKFRAKDLMGVLEKNGYNPNSISHYLRRATEAKLIRKMAGTQGSATQYERL